MVQLQAIHFDSEWTIPNAEHLEAIWIRRNWWIEQGPVSKYRNPAWQVNVPEAQIMSSCALQDNFDDAIGLYQQDCVLPNQSEQMTTMNLMWCRVLKKAAVVQEGVVEEEGVEAGTTWKKDEVVEEAAEEAGTEEEIASKSKAAVMLRTNTILPQNMPSWTPSEV